MFSEESTKQAVQAMILDYGFKFPMSLVLIGANGTFLTGKLELSFITKKLKTTLVSGGANKLRFPINATFVDAGGKVAQITFKKAGGKDEAISINVSTDKKVGELVN